MSLMLPAATRERARSAYWQAVCKMVSARAGGRVWSGPFAGSVHSADAVCSAALPKLLGTYERELQPCVEALARRRDWTVVIDVGAAEGYYAVGLARRTGARVLAFEMDPVGRRLLHDNVAANAVSERVEVRGECTPAVFADSLAAVEGPVLVVMDVEGAEAALVEHVQPRDLAKATFLIEVHDFNSPAGGPLLSARLRAAFEASHTIEVIRSASRTRADFPAAFWFVPPHNRPHAMDEYRPATMEWMVCTPRVDVSGPAGSLSTG
jgi:hypothetical protein